MCGGKGVGTKTQDTEARLWKGGWRHFCFAPYFIDLLYNFKWEHTVLQEPVKGLWSLSGTVRTQISDPRGLAVPGVLTASLGLNVNLSTMRGALMTLLSVDTICCQYMHNSILCSPAYTHTHTHTHTRTHTRARTRTHSPDWHANMFILSICLSLYLFTSFFLIILKFIYPFRERESTSRWKADRKEGTENPKQSPHY